MSQNVKKIVREAVMAGLFAGLGLVGAEDALAESPVPAAAKPNAKPDTKPNSKPTDGEAKAAASEAKPASGADHATEHGVPKGHVQCFGANTCKGQNGCAVTAGQIKAANEAFNNKFAATKPITCAGQAVCASKDGFLSWQSAPSAKDCSAKGGFLFERKDGKLVVKKS